MSHELCILETLWSLMKTANMRYCNSDISKNLQLWDKQTKRWKDKKIKGQEDKKTKRQELQKETRPKFCPMMR